MLIISCPRNLTSASQLFSILVFRLQNHNITDFYFQPITYFPMFVNYANNIQQIHVYVNILVK